MGKLDPSQQDRWWKSRIEKEELQYCIKAGITPESQAPTKEVVFLNSLGKAQVTSRSSETNVPGPRSLRDAPSRPQSARPPSVIAGATAGGPEAITSPKSVRMQDDARSTASGANPREQTVKLPSVACSQRSASRVSQAKADSQASMMRRLEGLEEALAAERVKRQQAEEEMRQLMALAAQQRRAAR